MDNNEKKVDDALSDIFDTDFLEINIDDNKKTDEKNVDGSIEIKTTIIEDKNLLNDKKKIDDFEFNVNENLYKDNGLVESSNSATNIDEDNFESFHNQTLNEIEKKEDVSSKKSNKKLLICIIIVFLVMVIIIFLIVNTAANVERKTYCSYEASDAGFKLTDEYTITYKGNNITYVEGTYIYSALNEEFKPQIEFIKDEKLPVIINSNGMAGFTHIFEESENYIKISSYYDTTLIDFSKVDKNNDKLMPISYIDLKSDVTYKKLKQTLEKEGYKCTVSK